MPILLVPISGYFINGSSWQLVTILLVVIQLMIISGYFIIGY
jgi:hypothetical protein